MISRKRARRDGGAPGPTSSTTSLQPTRASTSSQVSDLSAAPVTSPSQPASEPAQGAPPPALRHLETSSKSEKSSSSVASGQEGNKTVGQPDCPPPFPSNKSRAGPLTPRTGSQNKELVWIMASEVHTFYLYTKRNDTRQPPQGWLHA